MENKREILLIEKYCDVWNEQDFENRRSLLTEIWNDSSKYIDPRSNLNGVEALVKHIEKIRSTRKDTQITRTSNLDIHHNIGRFNWALLDEEKTILLKGIDIVYFNEQVNKIQKIIGFFGDLNDMD